MDQIKDLPDKQQDDVKKFLNKKEEKPKIVQDDVYKDFIELAGKKQDTSEDLSEGKNEDDLRKAERMAALKERKLSKKLDR